MFFKCIICVFALFITLDLLAEDNYGNIRGQIIEQKSKLPISNSVIIILENNISVISDSNGYFRFEKINVGKYTLKINSQGYLQSILPNISIIKNKEIFKTIELSEDVRISDDIEVVSFRYENDRRTPISTFSFSRDEISLNPGAQGDIFRAIGMLPGVTSSGGIYSAIAVRGQGVRDNVYMVDDIPLTEVGHLEGNSFFNDPNGGRFSIFAPRVIDNAVFQGGTFSPEFGRRSASYLGLNIKEGNKGSSVYDGQIDLLGVTANYDGPAYFHKNTTMFVSARYQNFYPLVHIVGLKNLGLPIYSDLILKTTTDLNPYNKLNFLFMICPESFVRDMENVYDDKELNLLYLPDFKRNKIVAGLNLRSILGTNTVWKNVLYYTNYSSDISVGKAFPAIDSNGILKSAKFSSIDQIQTQLYRENKIGFRSIIETSISSSSTLNMGIEGDFLQLVNDRNLLVNDTNFVFRRQQLMDTNLNYQIITANLINAKFDDGKANASIFTNYLFDIGAKFSGQIGARLDYSGFSEQTVISPRLNLSYAIEQNHNLSFGFGLFYQDPIYSDIADLPRVIILEMEKITQFILSYKAYLSNDLKVTIETWYKDYDNMVVTPISGSIFKYNYGKGIGKGLDVSITKRLSKEWHGQISYSFMDVKLNDNDGLGEYDFTYSQPHQLNLMISYKLDDNWSFSGKYRFATGRPTDSFIIHKNVLDNPNYYIYSMELIGRNQSRLPDFSSLDLRMNYEFNISNFKFTMFFDVVNILNRQIANSENFNYLKGETYFDGLAIFPTGGLKFEF